MNQIPRTATEAVEALTEAGTLVTAKEWERAALVYALAGDGAEHPLDPAALAKVGVMGLSSKNAVIRYRDAWVHAIEQGAAQPVTLGSTYVEPNLPWVPDTNHNRLGNGERRAAIEAMAEQEGVSKGSALRVAESPRAIAAVIKADPKIAQIVAAAMVSSTHGFTAITEAVKAENIQRHPTVRATPRPAPNALLWRSRTATQAADDLVVLANEQDLSESERNLMAQAGQRLIAAGQMLQSISQGANLHDEVEAFLTAGGQS